jgi:hypothetical protein
VFTFATTGGVAITVNAGDRLTLVAPGSQDATLSDVGITLVGTRGSVSAAVSAPPSALHWMGAYSGATAYSPYDVVSYNGSSYICILASTGNLPTNTTYWNLVVSVGTAGTNGTNGTNGSNGQMLYLDDQNQTQVYAADSGTANAYAVTLANSPGSYVAGQRVVFKVANANTGASTINVNSLGTKSLTKSGTTALASGDLVAGQVVTAVYDGTQFQLQGVGGGSTTYFGYAEGTAATSANYKVTLGSTPITNSVRIWVQGLLKKPSSYTLSGTVASFLATFTSGDVIVAEWVTANATPGSITVSGGFTALTRSGWGCTVSSNAFGGGGSNPTTVVGGAGGVWITNTHPQNIIIDMASAQSFNCIQITPNQSNAIGQAYSLDVSSNGTTWTSTGETISGLPATVTMQQWALTTTYNSRYIRINVTADNGFVSMATVNVGTLI